VVARQHKGTINMRYLAPPVALAGIVLGVLGGFLWWPLWLVPAAYEALVVDAGLPLGRGLPWAARPLIPVALAIMHLSWGWGLHTSPPSLGSDSRTAQEARS